MVAPALLLFACFYVAPVVVGVVLSFFRWNGLESPVYVGFANFDLLLFNDPVFLTNVRVSLIVVGASLALTIPIALLLALSLSGTGRLLPLIRWIVFLPAILPLTAVALLWTQMLSPTNGPVNEILSKLGLSTVAWLGDADAALWALIAVSVWSSLPLHIVLQLSGLSAIPTSLREAARLETKSSWKVFRHVVLPLLRESLTVSSALVVTGAFLSFTSLAFIMTRGGPLHATEVLGVRSYLEAFSALEFGRASAITVATMVISVALVGTILAIGNRKRVEF
jgi:ABC-type sugar transport system permease subunit